MLISYPLDFPMVVPDDWDKWWSVWSKEAVFVPKVGKNANMLGAMWKGFDIYVANNVDSINDTQYKCKNINCTDLFTNVFNNVDLLPIDVSIMRVVSSLGPVLPHRDFTNDISIRSMLYDTNTQPTFYYTNGTIKQYQKLPPETNTWGYWDTNTKHGTDFRNGHNKILVMWFGKTKKQTEQLCYQISKQKFEPYHVFNKQPI